MDRHTLDTGVIWLGQLLQTLREPMRRELFDLHYTQADETPVGVKSPLVQGRLHRAYLFEYSHPRGVVVFDFRMGRGGEGPRQFLDGFTGVLQCDGYAGYDDLAPPGSAETLVRAGCLAHMRRYFFKAHEIAPRETEALAVVEKLAAIYHVESGVVEPAARLALRQGQSVSLMAELKP